MQMIITISNQDSLHQTATKYDKASWHNGIPPQFCQKNAKRPKLFSFGPRVLIKKKLRFLQIIHNTA